MSKQYKTKILSSTKQELKLDKQQLPPDLLKELLEIQPDILNLWINHELQYTQIPKYHNQKIHKITSNIENMLELLVLAGSPIVEQVKPPIIPQIQTIQQYRNMLNNFNNQIHIIQNQL